MASRILLADADPAVLSLVSRRLERRGYDVSTASDGQAALDELRSGRPDAAVLDWVMPVMKGHEVCERLKADPATATIPVVLLDARRGEGDAVLSVETSADGCLTKPFDIDELDDVLRALLGSDR